jgi:hypothetical protein
MKARARIIILFVSVSICIFARVDTENSKFSDVPLDETPIAQTDAGNLALSF